MDIENIKSTNTQESTPVQKEFEGAKKETHITGDNEAVKDYKNGEGEQLKTMISVQAKIDLSEIQRIREEITGKSGHNQETQNTIKTYEDLLAELDKAGIDESKILKICTEDNLVGHGGNADVYKIPYVENYVLRFVRYSKDERIDNNNIEEVKDEFPEINIGQAVAKIGEQIYFLKKQNGIPAGVPAGKLRKENKIADPIYEEQLKLAAEMPQSAYDEFARTLVIINARNHQFDPSKANNVLIDSQSGKFNLVDINERSANSTYKNEMADMVVTLMDNSYAYQYKGSVKLEAYRKVILEKCIEAGKNAGFPVPEVGQNSSLDYSFKLAGLERIEA